MASQNNEFSIPWSTIFVLISALGGISYYLTLQPSQRPAAPVIGSPAPIGLQDIDARLWQDPFQAISDGKSHQEKSSSGSSTEDALPGRSGKIPDVSEKIGPDSLLTTLRHRDPKHILLLPVMVPGGPFFEEAETRLRTRVAIVSALGSSQCAPDDAEHVGLIRLPRWPKTQGGLFGEPQAEETALDVPFEWWHFREDEKDCILVLWINENCFADFPLLRLDRMLAAIQYPAMQKEFHATVSVIGPARSATLDSMVDEMYTFVEPKVMTLIEEHQLLKSNDWLRASFPLQQSLRDDNLHIYSPKATADPSLVLYDYTEVAAELLADQFDNLQTHYFGARYLLDIGEKAVDCLAAAALRQRPLETKIAPILQRQANVQFESTTATDTDLCAQMVSELHLRGIDATHDPIAIVSEWDTYYARSLQLSFAYAARDHSRKGPKDPSDFELPEPTMAPAPRPGRLSEPFPSNIEAFNYLRGIDGRLPQEGSDQGHPASADRQPAGKIPFVTTPSAEVGRPDGRDQADYLLRLAAEIKRREMRFRRDNPAEKGFRAIGIFGSDFYDKIEVLQALRAQFPNAVFFTTDLDARLCTASQWKAAHNLLIASPFGLRLKEKLQKGIPPFRDSHQTALFYATQLAMRDMLAGPSTQPSSKHLLPAPRLFEVARSGPFDLSSNMPGTDMDASMHPTVNPMAVSEMWDGVYVTAGAAALLLIVLASNRIREDRRERSRPRIWPIVMAAMSLSAVVIGGIMATCGFASEEPFAWFDGISIWPTEIFRVIAACLSVWFVIYWNESLPDHTCEIFATYGRPRGTGAGGWISYCKRWLGGNDPCISIFLILAALGLALWRVYGWPHTPYRGPHAQYVDRIVVLISVAIYIFHSSFAAGFTTRTTDMIRSAMKEYAPSENLSELGIDEYRRLHALGEATRPVESLIASPFAVLAILIVSYGNYFADWGLPLPLILFLALIFMPPVLAGWKMRRAAENVRRKLIKNIKKPLAPDSNAPPSPNQAARLQKIVDDLQSYRGGAFGQFSQHPVLGAILIPSSGLGILGLLQYLMS